MIKWIKKKLSNYVLMKREKIEEEVISFLKNPKNTIAQKYSKLIVSEKFLNPNDYKKWEFFLKRYEELNNLND